MTKAADMFSLKGRVALVTGASSGLGQQFAFMPDPSVRAGERIDSILRDIEPEPPDIGLPDLEPTDGEPDDGHDDD